MKHAMVATWEMAFEGVRSGFSTLAAQDDLRTAIAQAVMAVENDPAFTSVGYGGLPNLDGHVEMDAGYMIGDTLGFGAVMGVSCIRNPILVAQDLTALNYSCVLCGSGAEQYAQERGFEFANMLTPESRQLWAEKRKSEDLTAQAYKESHDTVCVIGKCGSHLEAGVSTSGLFMKHPGRVGDSPIIGSGLYCDSEVGGAAATGMGEDIMKGCLSYETVRLMKQGVPVQTACETALNEHIASMTRHGREFGEMSVLAMDKDGNCGAASSIIFPFVYQNDDCETSLYLAVPQADKATQIRRIR